MHEGKEGKYFILWRIFSSFFCDHLLNAGTIENAMVLINAT